MGINSSTIHPMDVTNSSVSRPSLPKARGKGDDEKPTTIDGDSIKPTTWYGKLANAGKPWGGIGPLIMTIPAVIGGTVGVAGTYMCYENSKKSLALSQRSLAISDINLKEDQNKNRGRITPLAPIADESISVDPKNRQAMTVYSPRESLSTMQANA